MNNVEITLLADTAGLLAKHGKCFSLAVGIKPLEENCRPEDIDGFEKMAKEIDQLSEQWQALRKKIGK